MKTEIPIEIKLPIKEIQLENSKPDTLKKNSIPFKMSSISYYWTLQFIHYDLR